MTTPQTKQYLVTKDQFGALLNESEVVPGSSFDVALRTAFRLRRNDPAITLAPLPGLLNGLWQWNATPWIQDNVTTVGDTQYAIWVNDSLNPVIGKRALPGGGWETFDLSTVVGNPLAAPTVADGHNTYAVARDSAGYLHVVGNMHTDALRYVRSTNPDDITAWAVGAMVGTEETSVTYPGFITHPDGTLLFAYRDGGSGNGDTILNKLTDPAGHTWARVATVLTGSSTDSAYPNHIDCDADGVIHLGYMWRGDASSIDFNNDVCYVRSADKGATWTDIDGNALALPITHATSPKVIDTADTGAGLINNGGLMADMHGHPHMAIIGSDGANRQVLHVWHDGTTWHNDPVTDFTATGLSTSGSWPPRPSVVCHDDRVYIVHMYGFEGHRGALRMIDVTPGRDGYDSFPIAELDLRYYEPVFDSRALRDQGQLHMLIGAMNREQSDGAEYWHDDNWSRQWGGVLTIDMDRISDLQDRTARLPRIRSLGAHAAPWNTDVVNTSMNVLGGNAGGALIPPPEVRGKLVFARVLARGVVSAAGTTLTVGFRELQNGGGSPSLTRVAMTFTSTGSTIKQGPWMPLVNGPRNLLDCFVDIQAMTAGAGTSTLSVCVLEIGVLDVAD